MKKRQIRCPVQKLSVDKKGHLLIAAPNLVKTKT